MLKIKHTQHIQFAAAVRSSKTDAAALVSALALALALPLALASALALALALALAASFALALAFPSASGLLLASRTRGTRAPPRRRLHRPFCLGDLGLFLVGLGL